MFACTSTIYQARLSSRGPLWNRKWKSKKTLSMYRQYRGYTSSMYAKVHFSNHQHTNGAL